MRRAARTDATQGELFAASADLADIRITVRRDDSRLVCANGEPWMGPHPICDAQTDEACQQFDEMVVAGIYNEQGFTPAEWKAYQRKVKKVKTS